MSLDVLNKKLYKSFYHWNLGRQTFKLLKAISEEERVVFKKAVIIAITRAAIYLQRKLLLDNKLLMYLLSLDTKCHGAEAACSAMKRWGSYFSNVTNKEEIDAYNADVDKYHLLDKEDPPSIWKTDGKTPQRLFHWWHDVI